MTLLYANPKGNVTRIETHIIYSTKKLKKLCLRCYDSRSETFLIIFFTVYKVSIFLQKDALLALKAAQKPMSKLTVFPPIFAKL